MSAQLVTPERIKALRRKHGWTQAQAAPKLNVSLRTLVSLEKGVQLRPMTLAGIALILQDIEKAEDGGLFFGFGMCKKDREVIYHLVNVTKKYPSKNHALFLACGNSITVCSSTVSLACSSICERFSRKYWAAKAIASSLTASFQAAFAAFRWRALLSRLANCKSCKVIFETSNRYSGFGISLKGYPRRQVLRAGQYHAMVPTV